jgi:DNA-binding NtrC family response regulator
MMPKHFLVLILEDELNLASTLSLALEKSAGIDCTIKICSTAEAALQVLQVYPVDLLITDWQLPGMTGLELARKSREQYPGLPVIFMTAFGSDDLEEEARAISDFFINKPFEIQEFIHIVVQVLAAYQIMSPSRSDNEQPDEAAVNILVLEEDRSLLGLFQKIFNNLGYRTRLAQTVAEAEKHLMNEHFEILMCDIQLEHGPSLTLLEDWADELVKRRTKVFVISSDPWYRLIKARAAGDIFIQKPVQIPAIVKLTKGITKQKSRNTAGF